MCGIVGIVDQSAVNQSLYEALTILQHRGQDASGIVTFEKGRLHLRKANGMVRDVFQQHHMDRLKGNIGIGHVRYPTAGSASSAESQPFYVNSPYGITLAHNGNLTNAEEMAKLLYQADLRHINTRSDSEVLLNILAHELQVLGKHLPSHEDLFAAVAGVHKRCRGAYAAVAMIAGHGILAFRDPFGIRPLVYGSKKTDSGTAYMVASESVALKSLGFGDIQDVAPGEAVFISCEGDLVVQQCAETPRLRPCLFEYVYLARPDSIIEGVPVYSARLSMGVYLAQKIQREWSRYDIDVVIPIPDTSRTIALEMANIMGIKYREGFVKNRYIARTFIMPGQKLRKKSVRQKLNAIDFEFKDKNVLLVDDSIVRGTTCEQIVQMARDAGAKSVYFASAAPPVRYPNVYGIDMPNVEELIAHNRTVEEVRELIGADDLIFQDLEDLNRSIKEYSDHIERLDCSVFDGVYVTGDIDDDYLSRLQAARGESAQQTPAVEEIDAPKNHEVIELHNAT